MAVTFIAPHSLHARPMVVPRGLDLEIRNRTPDVRVTVLLDGHALAEVGFGAPIVEELRGVVEALESYQEAGSGKRDS
jgi:NAD kinase